MKNSIFELSQKRWEVVSRLPSKRFLSPRRIEFCGRGRSLNEVQKVPDELSVQYKLNSQRTVVIIIHQSQFLQIKSWINHKKQTIHHSSIVVFDGFSFQLWKLLQLQQYAAMVAAELIYNHLNSLWISSIAPQNFCWFLDSICLQRLRVMVLRWMRGSPSLSFRNLSSLLDSRKTSEGLSWLTLIILFVFCGIFLSGCTSLLRGASLPRAVRLVLSTSLTPICSNWYFLSRLLTYLSRCSSEYCGAGSSSS